MSSEFSGSSVFLIEHFGKHRAGIAGGIILASAITGSLVASLLSFFFLKDLENSWLWRIPFLLGGLTGFTGFYIRFKIDETPDFNEAYNDKKLEKIPLKRIFTQYLIQLLLAIGISGYGGTISYVLVAYINIYLYKVIGISLEQSLLYNSFGLFFFIIFSIFLGLISDKLGSEKTMIMATLLGITLSYPIFWLLNSKLIINILLAQIFLSLLASSFCAPQLAFMSNLFPVTVRYSGVCFAHAVGIALLGGTFPLISTLFIKNYKDIFFPAYYLMMCALIGLICTYAAKFFIINKKFIHEAEIVK